MTPKHKAIELVDLFIQMNLSFEYGNSYEYHKSCAILLVNEIISHIEPSISMDVLSARVKYWNEVIKEIEKL